MKTPFNGFENYLLTKGLELKVESIKEEIREAKAKNKNHLMTEDYIEIVGKELLRKVHNFTKKDL
tara:strand:+ start:145 stop:339 length:195 start_codon:yes stop_codon:yes gene_type:complete